MKLHVLILLFVTGLAGLAAAGPAISGPAYFITAKDGKLYDGTNEFRFISLNIPNLLEIEDNVAFGSNTPWRLPDSYEINDALATIRQMGGQVARTYAISVRRTNDAPGTPRYVLGPGQFDETAFRTMDRVLAAANRLGVRLIIPLVDNWPWMGGRAEYAGFRGKPADAFWSDPQLIADFESTIRFVLARTNTVTGVRYADDKAILCWETGNELAAPTAWTREIARYIKSLDPNHLVMDGRNAARLGDDSLAIPEVDMVTTHHYPGHQESFAELIRKNAARAKNRKPYVVGEFGFVDTAKMSDALRAIRESGAAGGLLWSLRFHDRDGGFYWHSEPSGGDVYKAFHWPGSRVGDAYDEIRLLSLVRSNAFAIRGLATPAMPVPAAPECLPVSDAAAISWRGSVGAASYQVERAPEKDGPWKVIAASVDEAATQYHPPFADEQAPAGRWFYRVRARNGSGVSEPSKVSGPVTVTQDTLVDELADFERLDSKTGAWKIATHNCRAAKEDAARAAGVAGDTLVYRTPENITGFRVFAFFPGAQRVPRFLLGDENHVFRPVTVRVENDFQGAGEYGYWRAVELRANDLAGGNRLKIELTTETQIGRVEITFPAKVYEPEH
jgi:hypothetical protein